MESQCRACLSTTSNEFIHLGSDFTENQTYFDCFNECTQLQTSWDDEFSQVICQSCLNILQMVFDFIKTAQKSDLMLRCRLNNKTQAAEPPNNEIFQETDIENMEIVVLETLEEPTLKETALDDYDCLISEDDKQLTGLKPYFQLPCPICNVYFEKETQLELHLQNEHNEGFIALPTCEICNKSFESSENLDLHTSIFHQSTTSTTCELCRESIKNDFEHISDHINIKHPVECAKLFNNIVETYISDELVEDCKIEENNAANEEYANNLDDIDSTMFTNGTLCKEEVMQSSFEKDMSKQTTHENHKKKFICSFCPSEFKIQKSLRLHEKMHCEANENEVHTCTDCNRQYSTASLLEHHRKNAHKQREYVCHICGNAFKLKNQLNGHMKLHLEKNISCPHCDKKYARPFDLTVHLRSHTGEMPFECHLCEKKFAIKVRLTYHLQKHYGIKHVCKECGAQFNSKPKLKAHSFKHTGMPYRCKLCDDHGFNNRDAFKRHLFRVHNATITEEDLLDMFQRNTGKSTRIRAVNTLSEKIANEMME